jgi:assimilatory nitrate reductase catalytic subunit
MTQSVTTTCPYCGVGCGLVATVATDGHVTVRGDKQHPANQGRLCSKGAALAETLGLEGRLLYPEVRGRRVDWDGALDEVAQRFSHIIAEHGPDAVAFYVSGQLLTEDYYVANKLMKGFIGSANIDTNSRLCMSSSVVGYKRAFGSDTVPCRYEDLEQANLVVLVGSNAAWCHPVLFQRMALAKKQNPHYRVVVIDPRRTSSCDIADLHLPLRSGSDSVLFNGLLHYLQENDYASPWFVQAHTEGAEEALQAARTSAGSLAEVAASCGVEEQLIEEFYRLFAQTERVVTVYSQGINQSSSGSDKVNAIINCHLLTGRIGRAGMGPFSFTGQPNAMGGREVGGLANQLAAHMDIANPEHRDCVQRFWQAPTVASRPGLKAVDLFQSVAAGKVKAVWVMATNPAVSLPQADAVRDALAACDFVVVSDCVRDTDTTACADVLLPALTWGEKEGTVTNSERRISRQRAFLPAPGEARADWWIISQVAQRMGFGAAFSFSSPAQIFREHAALSGFENSGQRDFDISALAELDEDDYTQLEPVQWPLSRQNAADATRLFADGRFFTPSQKAQLVAISPRPAAIVCDADFPYVLNTGRVRDQWHTMTRTAKTPRLAEHSPEPYMEVHPQDALAKGVEDESLVRVFSRWGEVIVRARLSEQQRPGNVFIPMHWNAQFASHGRIGAVVNAAVDPLSGQPESKHTPVNFVRYTPAWHGFLLSRRRLQFKDASYWVQATGKGFFRYELAGEQAPGDWPAWSRQLLCQADDDVNWVEYMDEASRCYRGVRLVGQGIESCIFIAPDHQLPSRNWLAGLFAKASLSEEERAALLLGRALAGQKDVGPMVCACFGVGRNTILEAIEQQGLSTPEEIGSCLKAGTNCGSCIPELRSLLAKRRAD